MKAIPVLGIPHYNRPDLLARCIASIDYAVERLVIVQNGSDDEMIVLNEGDIFACGRNELMKVGSYGCDFIGRVELIQHPNAGVAASWNEIIQIFPAPWWMIANNDIQFAPGDLKKMAAAAWEQHAPTPPQGLTKEAAAEWIRKNPPVGKLFGNHGASWFVVTSYGITHVGLFDENFYPAYLEDCDWHHRAKVARVATRNVPDVHAVHGDQKLTGSCTVNSDPALREKNVQTHSRNFGYYEYKWGGRNGAEKYQTPYNEPLPVWAWRFYPEFRRQQQW